jgi:hypothetical protein
MADASQDARSKEDRARSAPDDQVELAGFLDEEPAGVVRLFEEKARDGRYVDVKVEDVVDRRPWQGGQTAVAVSRDAVIVVCTPTAAGELGDATTDELQPPHTTGSWPRDIKES